MEPDRVDVEALEVLWSKRLKQYEMLNGSLLLSRVEYTDILLALAELKRLRAAAYWLMREVEEVSFLLPSDNPQWDRLRKALAAYRTAGDAGAGEKVEPQTLGDA